MDNSDKFWMRWGLGGLLPLCALVTGIPGLFTKSYTFTNHGSGYTVHGPGAIAASLACITFGLCFHIFFFWEDRDGFEGWHGLLSLLSLILFIGCAGYCGYLVLQ